jgi:hypothetical protein
MSYKCYTIFKQIRKIEYEIDRQRFSENEFKKLYLSKILEAYQRRYHERCKNFETLRKFISKNRS